MNRKLPTKKLPFQFGELDLQSHMISVSMTGRSQRLILFLGNSWLCPPCFNYVSCMLQHFVFCTISSFFYIHVPMILTSASNKSTRCFSRYVMLQHLLSPLNAWKPAFLASTLSTQHEERSFQGVQGFFCCPKSMPQQPHQESERSQLFIIFGSVGRSSK